MILWSERHFLISSPQCWFHRNVQESLPSWVVLQRQCGSLSIIHKNLLIPYPFSNLIPSGWALGFPKSPRSNSPGSQAHFYMREAAFWAPDNWLVCPETQKLLVILKGNDLRLTTDSLGAFWYGGDKNASPSSVCPRQQEQKTIIPIAFCVWVVLALGLVT